MGSSSAGPGAWSLEVVRGRDAGRTYPLNGGEVVLGNALGGAPGIDLADQEGASPRRMAAQQARLECSPTGLALRDLDSPGGTFVNRQRVLSGQARPLSDGDLIQLGGVQLRVVRQPAASPPRTPSTTTDPGPRTKDQGQASPPRTPSTTTDPGPRTKDQGPRTKDTPLAFALRAGSVCRSWDDFLVVAAQRWGDLRDELTSGRLAAYLATIGRADLAPDPNLAGSPDERLDAWLGSLPTSRSSGPELEVIPTLIEVRTAGGGQTRRKLTITNTGHRLLRSTVRVEPAGTSWLTTEGISGPIVTVDATEINLVIKPPDPLNGRLTAALVVESNGGSQRVAVQVEPQTARDAIPEGPAGAPARVDWGIREWIAGQSLARRLAWWSGSCLIGRLLIGLAGSIVPAGASGAWPDLRGPALLFAALGAVAGTILALRRGERRDLPSGAFAGAFAGVLAASLAVAACRSIEPILGTMLGHSILATAILWAAIGTALAVASAWLVPPTGSKGGSP